MKKSGVILTILCIATGNLAQAATFSKVACNLGSSKGNIVVDAAKKIYKRNGRVMQVKSISQSATSITVKFDTPMTTDPASLKIKAPARMELGEIVAATVIITDNGNVAEVSEYNCTFSK